MSKVNIILFGPAGSGKGTQSTFLVNKFGLKHISTGDVIRKEIQNETALAGVLKRLSPGALAPDEIVIKMVENFILEHKDAPGFLFDGFPRTEPQSIALEDMLQQHGQSISRLILLDVPDLVLIPRIQEGAKIEGCADDNDPEAIARRLESFKNQTMHVLRHFSKPNRITIVNGNQPIELVSDAIYFAVSRLFGKSDVTIIDDHNVAIH